MLPEKQNKKKQKKSSKFDTGNQALSASIYKHRTVSGYLRHWGAIECRLRIPDFGSGTVQVPLPFKLCSFSMPTLLKIEIISL